jgi:hypothetical protein
VVENQNNPLFCDNPVWLQRSLRDPSILGGGSFNGLIPFWWVHTAAVRRSSTILTLPCAPPLPHRADLMGSTLMPGPHRSSGDRLDYASLIHVRHKSIFALPRSYNSVCRTTATSSIRITVPPAISTTADSWYRTYKMLRKQRSISTRRARTTEQCPSTSAHYRVERPNPAVANAHCSILRIPIFTTSPTIGNRPHAT